MGAKPEKLIEGEKKPFYNKNLVSLKVVLFIFFGGKCSTSTIILHSISKYCSPILDHSQASAVYTPFCPCTWSPLA